MHTLLFRRHGSPHAERLERWYGKEAFAQILEAIAPTRHPLPILNAPGQLFGYRGELYGHSPIGAAACWQDYVWDKLRRVARALARNGQLNMGFASLSDALSEATTGGKLQAPLTISKVGPTGVVGVTSSLWRLGNVPAAGSVGAALAGGTTYDRTSTGALGPQVNAAGGDTLHLMSAMASATVAANCLLVYDRLWAGAPNMNSSSPQTVTYTRPTRYGDSEVQGTFAFLAVTGTPLAAQAHNINGQYTDEAGNTAQAFQQVAGVASAIVDRLDHAGWMLPLAAGDVGIRTITQLTLSAAVATGSAELVHGRQLALLPCPFANVMMPYNFFGSLFNPVRIKDDACLALLEVNKGATTATTYTGHLTVCSG